jgi:pantoate kinase
MDRDYKKLIKKEKGLEKDTKKVLDKDKKRDKFVKAGKKAMRNLNKSD